MEVINIDEKEFEDKVINSKSKVLVDFYADWCGPCKMLSPVIDEMAKDYKDVSFYKINVDNAGDISRKYGVMSIPTLILFNNGEQIDKNVGLLSRNELKNFIEK